MAKLKMKSIELIAPLEQSKEIVDLLQRMGTVELTDCEEDDALYKLSTGVTVSTFERFLTAAESAQKTLDKYAPQKKGLIKGLLSSFDGRKEVEFSDYLKKSDRADDILRECYKINSLEGDIREAEVDNVRCRTAMDALEPWLGLDIPMQSKGTETTAVFVGTFPIEYDVQSLLSALAEAAPDCSEVDVDIVSATQERTCAVIFCHRECEKEIFEALRELNFAWPGDPTKHPPKVRYERLCKQIESNDADSCSAQKEIAEFAGSREDIAFVADYFRIQKEKYSALEKLAMTNRVFVLRGYIPEKRVEKVVGALEKSYTVAVEVTDPDQETQDVPVLLENNAFAAPVESITEMYSLPGKDDIDPNPVMAFFYYVFFGLMLSDAGYGLLMVIAMLFAKAKLKLETRTKKTVNMFLYCGISTMFWGTMFGSWFGDAPQVIAREFFGKEIGSTAVWFEPVNDPMKLLLYSFLFGIIHLFVGLGVRFYMLWKDGKHLDAICDVVPVYLLVTGAAPLCAGIIIDVPTMLTTIGKYLAIAGAVLTVLTSGRSSKNILGKLGGGLYGLYNTASGYLGDILSYSRLLALGLSTGVIATVINLLGTMPGNKIVKLILFIFVFLVGHTANIAINLIGTYVHTNRLQYVEFFSKFYEGGGRSFTPLKANTKHFRFKEEIQ
ncbi:MAG: V-type ATP synthase subunit I [Acutalibacteraceae bacterium]